MHFLLDPFIFAIPTEDATPDSIESYFETLRTWAPIVLESNHKFWISYLIAQALTDIEQYPTYARLAQLDKYLDTYINADDKPYDIYTLQRACERMLAGPPLIEDYLTCYARVEVEPAEVQDLLPPEIIQRLHPVLKDAFVITLGFIAFAKEKEQHQQASNLLIATTDHYRGEDALALTLTVWEADQEDWVEIPLNTTWQIIYQPEQLDEIEGLTSFWQDSERGLEWAYRDLAARNKLDPDVHSLSNFKVGSGFTDSIASYHWYNHPDLLAAIFRAAIYAITCALPRTDRGKHKPLRTGKKSLEPQRTRDSDNATAWRVHVTRGHPGLRLHYWLTPDNIVELSTVAPHEIYDID